MTEPNGLTYQQLIREASEVCDSFGVVIRPRQRLDDHARVVLEQLRAFMISTDTAMEWPGTILFDPHDASQVERFTLNDSSSDILVSAADRLYAWEHPSLPEDLFLVRGGTPWLVTVAHEREAFLVLSDSEADSLLGTVQNLTVERRSEYEAG